MGSYCKCFILDIVIEFFFLFPKQNICCGYSNELSKMGKKYTLFAKISLNFEIITCDQLICTMDLKPNRKIHLKTTSIILRQFEVFSQKI